MERWRFGLLGAAWILATLIWAALALAQGSGQILVIQVSGVIDPTVAQYVSRTLDQAVREGAQTLVIELDTPGGSDASMRAVVQRILNSPLPVIVYVHPAGARAGSAGVFITLAGHLAAMAPSTNIGAAHPVDLGGGEIEGTLGEKITNDAAAYIRSIAQQRERSPEAVAWAERAVRESVSITEGEALAQGVIDLVATDLPDLLKRVDGRRVRTLSGEVTLETTGVTATILEMTLAERFLHFLVNPNIAYLLLTLGIWALVAEFYNPGTVIPGATGILCLILAFIAFESLPLNWGGILLILVAILLFILDIKVAGFALSVFGAIAFILGSLILFSPFTPVPPSAPTLRVNPLLVLATTALVGAFFLFVVSKGLATRRLPVAFGNMQALLGARGVTKSALMPTGTVLVESEDWMAEAEEEISAGEEVEVIGIEGLKLRVRRKSWEK